MTLSSLLPLVVNGAVVGSVYAMIAIGFVVIYKTTRVMNFAQGELLMIGAYVCLMFTVDYQIPFWFSFMMTAVVCAILGYAIEKVVLRRVVGDPVVSIIMITLGLSIVLRAIVGGVFVVSVRLLPTPVPEGAVLVAGAPVSYQYIFSMAFSLLAMCAFGAFFRWSRLGLAMRATSSDQQVAMAMGIM